MSTPTWTEVASRLRERRLKTTPEDTAAFAIDFKARTALVRQDRPEAVTKPVSRLRWGYATALATVLILAGVVALPVRSTSVRQIKALEVVAPHDGVIIMTDPKGRGTILWVTGMEAADGKG